MKGGAKLLAMSGAGSDEPDRAWAHAYGAHLLSSLGVSADLADFRADCPAISWARAGLANVTGMQAGPPLAAPVAVSAAADGALAALGALAQSVSLKAMRGSALLGARARLNRLQRQGATSPGGSCKLLHTADGMVAVNLPRQSDWDFAPAWLEQSASSWCELAAGLLSMHSETALARARLLGLAVGPADIVPPAAPWFKAARLGVARPRPSPSTPLVIDLSSLWAGPLCGDLLGRLGARVFKVESVRRPDGARTGDGDFYAMLNGAKASLSLDFADRNDLALLERLIRMADIVIESARPRALRQLGLDAETLVRETPGLTWIALSAYGRDEPEGDWVGFGDDCGAAGGLSRLMQEVSGEAIFCGDAIADPLAGIHAALLAWSSWKRGGGVLNAIALRDVVASVVAMDAGLSASERRARWLTWTQLATTMAAKPYRLPPPQGAAEALGASNHLLHTL